MIIITFGVGGGVARVPQAPLDFPSVSCKSNTPLGAAGTPRGAADTLGGAADTLPGAAKTATFTAFTSFLVKGFQGSDPKVKTTFFEAFPY